jgi:predicted NACHT family NTPase
MAIIDLSMIIAMIVEMGVDATWGEVKRQEAVMRILDRFGVKLDIPPRFDDVYAFTLVAYGVGKPEPVLDFFRHESIKQAFKQSFEQRDPSILDDEAENLLDWAKVGKDLRRMDVDPRREFSRFTIVFNEIVDRTRTPAEVRREHMLKDVYLTIVQILDRLDSLPQSIEQKQANWDTLREGYLKAVRENYRMLELCGLAPLLFEGPPELSLSEVYVELPLSMGLEPLKEYVEHEAETRPPLGLERRLPARLANGQVGIGEPGQEEIQIEYELIERDRKDGEKSIPRMVSVWDAVAQGRTVIVGEAGAGKTTTLRYLALTLAGELGLGMRVDPRFSGKIPILVRGWFILADN